MQPLLSDIAHHAHDRGPDRVTRGGCEDGEPMAHRILAGEIRLRHGLVDDDRLRRVGSILRHERPAAQHRDLQHAVDVGVHDPDVRVRWLCCGRSYVG
jgi:hypothetical protein